jgi:alpha-D-xyloside xylohydrolase
LEVRSGHEVILAEAWGPDAIRVRLGRHRIRRQSEGFFGEEPPGGDRARAATQVQDWDGSLGKLTCGRLRLEIWADKAGWDGGFGFKFVDSTNGQTLLEQHRIHFSWPGGHLLDGNGYGSYRCVQEFWAAPGERHFGLGGRPSGQLSLDGQSFDLVQRNGEVCIPFVLSSLGYGFIWNHPGTGRAEFNSQVVRWTADQAPQIDFLVFAGGSSAQVLRAYADLTGHAPVMPSWALGLWQSHLRYTHQDQIAAVAREYADRGLPLSVIVSDGGHWPAMGEYRFDPAEYPDPAALVEELDQLGCRLMVSVWPTVSPLAEAYPDWQRQGLLVAGEQGPEFTTVMTDKPPDRPIPLALVDVTNPKARQYLWQRIADGYHRLGIRMFWLDANEPEHLPGTNRNLSFYAGPGEQVVNRYPLDEARALARGGADVVLLSRSAWLGQQALGCAVWSGDIPATWDSLARQVKVGLQMGLSGIPWWTSDIGGFFGGDPQDPDYQELFVRWLQFGAHCPLFRIHGIRDPQVAPGVGASGELWAFGEQVYPILEATAQRRERLRPYLADLAQEASDRGLPLMRPMWLEFPQDPAAWDIEDQYMLGDRLLVAPITEPGARERTIYLPPDTRWRLGETVYDAAGQFTVPAPLEAIPVLERLAN